MDIQTTGYKSAQPNNTQVGLDDLFSSAKLPIKIESLNNQQLTLSIQQQKLSLPIQHLDPSTQNKLNELVNKTIDSQQLQKLLATNLKLPLVVQNLDTKTVTLSINQQAIEVPRQLFSATAIQQLQQLASAQQHLIGQVAKQNNDWLLQLLQPSTRSQPLEHTITKQQLLQLLPTPNQHPTVTKTQLSQATTLVDLLGKLVGQKLHIGAVKFDVSDKLIAKLGNTRENILSQVKQAPNAIYLQLTGRQQSELAVLPLTEKNQLFKLVQLALNNNKSVNLNVKLSQQGGQLQLGQLKIPTQNQNNLAQTLISVQLSGNAEQAVIKTELPLLNFTTPVSQIKLNQDLLSQLLGVKKTPSANHDSTVQGLNGLNKLYLSSKEKAALQSTLRELIPNQQTASNLINFIQATAKSGSSELRTLLAALAQQLSKQLPNAEQVTTPEKVQQLIQPFLTSSPPSAQPPNSVTNFQQGLEGILQILLTAKVTKASGADLPLALQQRLLQFIATPVGNHSISQTLRQLAQSPLAAQLLQRVSGVFAAQKLARVSFADSVQQNNPQFFLSFPLNYDGQARELEVAIKPNYQQQEDQQQQASGQGSWQIQLRFDIPKLGLVMASAQLTGNKLTLDFYSDSQPLLVKINQHSETLQDRLTAAGLQLTSISAQQGKIPDSLQQKQHSLLYVRA